MLISHYHQRARVFVAVRTAPCDHKGMGAQLLILKAYMK